MIPANSKKSQLIFSAFTVPDLILFGAGIGLSLILLFVLPITELMFSVIALIPALITGFLVIPVPNYHNMGTILKTIIVFYTSRQKFIWKGWGLRDGSEQSK